MSAHAELLLSPSSLAESDQDSLAAAALSVGANDHGLKFAAA